jgi:AraC-like DNA-binding protein
MPSSAVRSFSDPDDYAATIRAGRVDLTVTKRGNFQAKLTRVDLHRLWMQRFSESLPRVCDVTDLLPGRVYVTFRTRPGTSLVQGGIEILGSAILRHGRTPQFYHRSSGPADFATMSLPLADMASVGEAMVAADLTAPREDISVAAPAETMARLQRLHAAAGHLAEAAPEIVANADAARGLEQALIEALAACLQRREEPEPIPAQGQHTIVMRRFRRVLEENSGQPIYIPEICRAIRVSERTLRVCCQEHLGMSPKRYLMLRRMHLARRALRAATGAETGVTEVATRFGFWQLGRFAVEYRSLFGEPPSETLRRPPG